MTVVFAATSVSWLAFPECSKQWTRITSQTRGPGLDRSPVAPILRIELVKRCPCRKKDSPNAARYEVFYCLLLLKTLTVTRIDFWWVLQVSKYFSRSIFIIKNIFSLKRCRWICEIIKMQIVACFLAVCSVITKQYPVLLLKFDFI
jgi:hypothetical protein